MTLSTTGAKYVALEGPVKGLLFLSYVSRLMLPEKNLPCFRFSGTITVLRNLPETNDQLKLNAILYLVYVIICLKNSSIRGILE